MRKFNLATLLIFMLACSVSFATDVDKAGVESAEFSSRAYKVLQEIEPDFSKLNPTQDVAEYNAQLRQIAEAEDFKEQAVKRPTLDFGNISFKQQAVNMVSILQTKLDCRNSTYETNYRTDLENSENEELADPYYSKLKTGNDVFNFTLDYNGGGDNVGNNSIRQSNRTVCIGHADRVKSLINGEAYKQVTGKDLYIGRVAYSCKKDVQQEEKYLAQLRANEALQNIMLGNELVRVKVVDHNRRDKRSAFSDLPIFSAVIMARELLSTAKIKAKEFWHVDGGYHIFTKIKGNRIQNIQNIISKYKDAHKNDITRLMAEKDINELEAFKELAQRLVDAQ